jgi:CheY-like chemotaxis protein
MSATVVSLKPTAQPKRRVLVVEDNLDSVHMMAVLVKMMGHEVRFAINGFAAIEEARRFLPEIILLDIGLPDFKGHVIARQLRHEPGLEKTRIIAVTGLPDSDGLRQRVLDAGCEGLYQKPLDPKKLEELLAQSR